MKLRKILFLIFPVLIFACADDPKPKPKGFLALEYPEPEYSRLDINCPFSFEKNDIATLAPARVDNPCWLNLEYGLMNGSIYLTYQEVNNNLDSLLRDAQKLPLQHTIKADAIEGDIYTNDIRSAYGMFYEVSGNAASQAQFYVTDSTNHFLTGSVYFNSLPNYDSIAPAADYLKRDIRYLMESLEWK
ncbi:gliding motility lipoprotein GldD [Salegentibacter sp. F188]|uniref:Gliding motility lipoprotein GldD n=1 Tax=Autumnicola patrickiae TaxID=3075591 RepID=A0ABU3E412_9FLAO|nr:gliding motility lipoprotein GldD [Salegentibacter sp. F188]MDT0690726.1 gliding motility lipoprotein GldD [Salegentibacter sp. F188]